MTSQLTIDSYKWGEITVHFKKFKDIQIHPGGVENWNWTINDIKHDPGIGLSDVMYLLDQGSKYIVLSRGMDKKLKIRQEVLDYLDKNKIPYDIKRTPEAIALYNKLIASNIKTGALIHSTC